MLATNKGFWDVFTAWAYGSAAGLTAVRRGKVQTMQKRRRGVLAKGPAPEYWRKVYAVVETLWNDLPDADKKTWLYGWKKYGNTGRDEFGHWNMNLVGRWASYLKQRPAPQSVEKRKTNWPGSIPLPDELDKCLPGTWHSVSPRLTRTSGMERIVNRWGATPAAAYAAAAAAIVTQPWVPSATIEASNYSFYHPALPSGWWLSIVQRWSEFQFGGLGVYVWRNPLFRIYKLTPYGGGDELPCKFGKTVLPAKSGIYVWPEVRAFSPATRYLARFDDLTGWAPPPMPGAPLLGAGWFFDFYTWSYEGRY